MRLNSTMRKLQKAITMTGLVVKINTTQFFSDDQGRLITIYHLQTPTWQKKKDGTMTMRDYEILRSASVIEIVKCLVDILKAVNEWRK